jgi:TraB/PrgY/gumN family
MVAEEKLSRAIGKKNSKGMRFVQVDSVVKKAARKHGVQIHELPWVKHKIKVEKPRAIVKAALNLDLAEGECVGRNLARIEKADAAGLLKYDVATTNAWATGDLEALRAKAAPAADLQSEDCGTAAMDAAMKSAATESTEISRGLDLLKQQEDLFKLASAEAERNWLDAVESALAKNDSTFAVLPMNLMTNQWVYLAKLKAKGYVVESPEEQ